MRIKVVPRLKNTLYVCKKCAGQTLWTSGNSFLQKVFLLLLFEPRYLLCVPGMHAYFPGDLFLRPFVKWEGAASCVSTDCLSPPFSLINAHYTTFCAMWKHHVETPCGNTMWKQYQQLLLPFPVSFQ